jgi:peptide chain release factor 2
LPEKEQKLKSLEKQTQSIDFWNDQENAKKISQEISDTKEELENIEALEKEIKEIEDLHKLADENLIGDLEIKLQNLEKEISKQEYKVFLSGKYDKNNAILEIFSGAGGVDAQDWVTMLLRMYQRYCQTKGFGVDILHQAFGEGGGPDGRIGTKSVTLEIQGKYAYGLLKRESGVHRLIRISPFSAQKLRHTAFASVQVLPELEEADKDVEIKPDDLKIDTFKAGGPGGQYTNKTESAIRITHLPTGIVVTSQAERLQGKNKETAMKVLRAKIFQLGQQEKQREIKEIKGKRMLAEFGSQTRNYVLHPYKLVKDLRTQYETRDAEAVLEGDLEEFIQAELKL